MERINSSQEQDIAFYCKGNESPKLFVDNVSKGNIVLLNIDNIMSKNNHLIIRKKDTDGPAGWYAEFT